MDMYINKVREPMTITGDKINALTLDNNFTFSSDASFNTLRRSFFVSQKISRPKTKRSRTINPIVGKSTPIKNNSIFSQSLKLTSLSQGIAANV
jgi:hypothetical protein